MLKNIKFSDNDKTIRTTLHLFCIKMFLEEIPTSLQSLKKNHQRKLEKLQGKEEKY